MHRTALVAAALVLALPGSSRAAEPRERERVALHTTRVVNAKPRQAEYIHALVAADIARHGANLVDSSRVDAHLAPRGAQGCAVELSAERNKCLADLARAVSANRAVMVTVTPNDPRRLLFSGVVVSADGTVLQTLEDVEYPRIADMKFESLLKAAIDEFVQRLNIYEVVVAPLIEPLAAPEPAAQPAAPNAVTAPPAATSVSQAPAAENTRTVAYAALGVGALALAGGVYGMVDASSQRSTFESSYADGRRPGPDEAARLAELRSAEARSRTLGVVGLGVGAALVGVGAYLLLDGGDASAGSAHLFVGPSGAAVRITFR